MTTDAPLICLVTTGHIASAPRLVKEADALADAGYRVHVVAGRHFEAADPLDADLLAASRWPCTRVDYRGGPGTLARKFIRHAAARMVVHEPRVGAAVAERAVHSETLRIAAVAARIPARLFVGHGVPGLAAAALAARERGVDYGFDAEDFHDAETASVMDKAAERIPTRLIQARYLAGCAHLTASAPLISAKYQESYGVRPRTVLNVFPRAMAPGAPVDPGPISAARPAVLYWFSQTVGPGRGLESMVAALGRMRTPSELHLRGFPSPGYAAHIHSLAARSGVARRVRFLPSGPPAEMARLAAGADLGLSTEERMPPNRDLCLTNKIFVYLMAGIPQVLSPTAAQAALAPELGQAALLEDLGDAGAVAAALDGFLGDANRMAAARAKARDLAANRFCWDLEKSKFLDSIASVAPLT